MIGRPRYRAPAWIGSVALVIALAGCSGGGDPVTVCTDAITEHMGAVFTDVQITENIETPIAVDVRGTYAHGGGFGCGLSLNPLTLEQAIVFPFDGNPITVVP